MPIYEEDYYDGPSVDDYFIQSGHKSFSREIIQWYKDTAPVAPWDLQKHLDKIDKIVRDAHEEQEAKYGPYEGDQYGRGRRTFHVGMPFWSKLNAINPLITHLLHHPEPKNTEDVRQMARAVEVSRSLELPFSMALAFYDLPASELIALSDLCRKYGVQKNTAGIPQLKRKAMQEANDRRGTQRPRTNLPIDAKGYYGVPPKLFRPIYDRGGLMALEAIFSFYVTYSLERSRERSPKVFRLFKTILPILAGMPLRSSRQIRNQLEALLILNRLPALAGIKYKANLLKIVPRMGLGGRLALLYLYFTKPNTEVRTLEDWTKAYQLLKPYVPLIAASFKAGASKYHAIRWFTKIGPEKAEKLFASLVEIANTLGYKHPLTEEVIQLLMVTEADDDYFLARAAAINYVAKRAKTFATFDVKTPPLKGPTVWHQVLAIMYGKGKFPSGGDLLSKDHFLEWVDKYKTGEAPIVQVTKAQMAYLRRQDRKAQLDPEWAIRTFPMEYQRGLRLSPLFERILVALNKIPGPLVIHGRDGEAIYQLAKRVDPKLFSRMRYVLSSRPLTTGARNLEGKYQTYLETVLPKDEKAVHIDTGFEGSIPDWFKRQGWNVSDIKLISSNRVERALLGEESMSGPLRHTVLADIEHSAQRLVEATPGSWGRWQFSPEAPGFWARLEGIVDGLNAPIRLKEMARVNPETIPLGDCFGWAFREQARLSKKNIESTLVHATITDPWDKKSFVHAWLERKGRAYDWQTVVALKRPRGRTIKQFREIWQPKNESRYTRLEAIRALLKHQHLGPWT